MDNCDNCIFRGQWCEKENKCPLFKEEQEIEEPHPWEHIWDGPDYTFKGRCRNCGFIHYFIQGHDAQYYICKINHKYCDLCETECQSLKQEGR